MAKVKINDGEFTEIETNITKAMEGIELSPQQIQDGERLRKNMFKTFYKVDKNTQNYSSKIFFSFIFKNSKLVSFTV